MGLVLDLLNDSSRTWREIARLATPLDADKKVIIGSNPKSSADFDAYTDDVQIYINLNDERKFRDNFERIVVPSYRIAANILYDVAKPVSDLELLTNLIFDSFLFIHFHEELHPWVGPNGKNDEKMINKALYEGIKEAEPALQKAEVLYKVNNSKNLVWDVLCNTSFVSKTAGYNNDPLEQKIKYVFTINNRQIEYQPITHYPSGILPIVYLTSAKNRKTDILISLVGAMYASQSFNDSRVRQNAMEIFLDDLQSKGIKQPDALEILCKMYKGFVSKTKDAELIERLIDRADYNKRVSIVPDFANANYEDNQRFFVAALTRIFDSPGLRYESLKGFIKVLSPFISLTQKQGSPDPNTKGSGGGTGSSEGKSQGEMDGDSMSETLDDLMGTLGDKESDDLLGDVANNSGPGMGPSAGVRKNVSILAADEYYKKNADLIEVQNPSQENVSINIGPSKKWKLVRSRTITAVDVAKLNGQQIATFERATRLPVLCDAGGGYWRLNEYVLQDTMLKSYTTQLTGIEIPDNWVLFQDSSGSMTMTGSYVGTKNKFDILNRVKYGIMKGMYDIAKALKKDPKFGVIDFSDKTEYKGLDSLIKVYNSRSHPIKTVSLSPQCGGTSINSGVFRDVEKDLAPGKTIATFITDGQIDGDTDPLYRAIERFVAKPQRAFVFVEVQSHSAFGTEIHGLSKTNKAVTYYPVSDVKSIKDKLSSVLIRYS